MKAEDKEARRCKVDYVYKRCYVDKHGNFVDPRTPWDELLKYRRHGQRVLTNREGKHLESVDRKARREVRIERISRQKQSQISRLETYDLEHMARRRKKNTRERIEKLATQNL